jgi:ketosteroid isomerase-like protein
MTDPTAVIRAAEARAEALGRGDGGELLALLHPAFRWTTHTGQVFDRAEYVARNTGGTTVWRSQALIDPSVAVVGDTAVLHAEVADVVLAENGEPETFRMPVTQVWVRDGGGWLVKPRRPCRPRWLTRSRRRMGTYGHACGPASSWVAGCGAGSSSG